MSGLPEFREMNNERGCDSDGGPDGVVTHLKTTETAMFRREEERAR